MCGDWQPIISEVDKAVVNITASLEMSEIGGQVKKSMSSDLLSLHHCDTGWIFAPNIAKWMIRWIEKASIILSEDERIGATLGILKKSGLGAIMICTDSHHFVWPNRKSCYIFCISSVVMSLNILLNNGITYHNSFETTAKLHRWEYYRICNVKLI